jgi:hypothetical protein
VKHFSRHGQSFGGKLFNELIAFMLAIVKSQLMAPNYSTHIRRKFQPDRFWERPMKLAVAGHRNSRTTPRHIPLLSSARTTRKVEIAQIWRRRSFSICPESLRLTPVISILLVFIRPKSSRSRMGVASSKIEWLWLDELVPCQERAKVE